MTNSNRFSLVIAEYSNDVEGWNGWLRDKAANKLIPLERWEIDYELHGETAYVRVAFPTKAAIIAKAKKVARSIIKSN